MPAILLIIGACVLWLLICARLWWMISRKNAWQRHLIALGAGLGAGLIYVFGQMVTGAVEAKMKQSTLPASGETIRVAPPAPKK